MKTGSNRLRGRLTGLRGRLTGLRGRLTGIEKWARGHGGFGMNELLGIAAGLIIAAFIIIPSLRTFAQKVMDGLSGWWGSTIEGKIFPSS